MAGERARGAREVLLSAQVGGAAGCRRNRPRPPSPRASSSAPDGVGRWRSRRPPRARSRSATMAASGVVDAGRSLAQRQPHSAAQHRGGEGQAPAFVAVAGVGRRCARRARSKISARAPGVSRSSSMCSDERRHGVGVGSGPPRRGRATPVEVAVQLEATRQVVEAGEGPSRPGRWWPESPRWASGSGRAGRAAGRRGRRQRSRRSVSDVKFPSDFDIFSPSDHDPAVVDPVAGEGLVPARRPGRARSRDGGRRGRCRRRGGRSRRRADRATSPRIRCASRDGPAPTGEGPGGLARAGLLPQHEVEWRALLLAGLDACPGAQRVEALAGQQAVAVDRRRPTGRRRRWSRRRRRGRRARRSARPCRPRTRWRGGSRWGA